MNIFNVFFMLKIAAKHWLALLLAAVVAGGAAFVYSTYFVTPRYSATGAILVTNGTILIDSEYTHESGKVENADITTSLSFAETVTDILETPGIYKELAAATGNKYSFNKLRSMINVDRRNEETLFIDVSITTDNAEESVNLVNLYLQLAPDYINGIVKNTASSITLADYAIPINMNTITITFFACVVSIAIVYLIIFAIYSSDSIIRDEDSFKERFDVPIIGVIPDFANAKSRESKYYRYSRYYYSYGGKKDGK